MTENTNKNNHPKCKGCIFHMENSTDPVYDQCCFSPTCRYRPRNYPSCSEFKLKVKS